MAARRWYRLWSALATAIAFSPSGEYAYVTYIHATSTPSGNTYWDTVQTYAVDHSTGQFSGPIGGAATGDNPWTIAVTPDGHYAYVASLSTQNGVNELSTYSINQTTGVLSLQSSLALQGAKPASLAMDPEGRFLYVGKQQPYYNQNLAVYSINPANGSLGTGVWGGLTGSGSLVGPIAVVAEPQGEFVYAMDVTGEIVPYSLNAATGELTPSGSAVTGAYVGGGTIGVGDPFFFAASGTSPVWVNGCTIQVNDAFVFNGCPMTFLSSSSGSGGGGGGGGGGGSSSPPTHYLSTTILQWGGTVVSTPAGINYSTIDLAKNSFGAGFPSDTSVQLCLTQTDNVQAYDVTWTGSGGCGGTSTCTSVYMNHDQSCSVTLTPVSTR